MNDKCPLLAAWPITGIIFYSLGSVNLYLPFPKPLTGSIKSAFFSFAMRLHAAVTESFVIAAMSERPNTPSTPIFANTAFAFAIVPWLAFSRSIANSIAIFSPSIGILFFGAGYKPVKIALVLPVLNDTVFLKFTLGKGFCDGRCHFPIMMQHFFLVKL